MSTTLARLLLGGFLIAHGLVHGLYFAPPEEDNPRWAFHLDRSWILEHLRVDPSAWRRIGLSLSVVVIAALVLAGLGVWAGVDAWRTAAVAGAAVALVLFALFWHRWLWIGTLMNAVIIVALAWGA